MFRTFLVPINSICSVACASPGSSFGSLKLPTLTFREALALSVSGSWTRRASSSLGKRTTLYDRSSSSGASSLSAIRSIGTMVARERVRRGGGVGVPGFPTWRRWVVGVGATAREKCRDET